MSDWNILNDEADYVPKCRHCKRTANEHEEDKCLFESTSFDPMSYAEFSEWADSFAPMFQEVPGIGIGNVAAIKKIQFK